MLDRLTRDVRYASRALFRSPVFTLVSIASIAIGIGATTAIVTLVNTLLLRPPPEVGHPGRLVMLGRTQDGHGFDTFSYPTFQEFSAARSLAGAAALDLEPKAVSLIGPSGGEPIQVTAVSGSMFAVLEARPGLGRFFTPEDDRAPGGNSVVVISHKFWERRFDADSSIVGRTIVMNRSPFTVIGVARERFQGPFVVAPDAWVPLAAGTHLGTPPSIFSNRESVWLIGIARLAPDVGILVHARSIDPGFEPRAVSIASIDVGLSNYTDDQGRRVAREVLERTRALPGVRTAALSAMLPLDGGGLGMGGIKVAGREPPDPREGWRADWNAVTPGYFATLGIPILRGRDFTDQDKSGVGDVAILNESFAAALFPGEDPVGRTLRNEDRTVMVIGVARNAKYRSLGEQPRNFIYVTLGQRYFGRIHLLIKSAAGAAAPGAAVRRIVATIDPTLPILRQQTMPEQTATSLFPQRLALYVSGGLGAVALLLVLIGIYGVTAFSVVQRTREIGVRVALGAQRSHVLGMVVRQGLVLVGIGVMLGSLAAFAATRLIRDLLYGVPPTDGIALGGAAALLVLAALVASWIPARRAARLDPVIALMTE